MQHIGPSAKRKILLAMFKRRSCLEKQLGRRWCTGVTISEQLAQLDREIYALDVDGKVAEHWVQEALKDQDLH